MAIALPLLVTLFAPLQGAVQWLSGGSAPASNASRAPQAPRHDAANDPQAHDPHADDGTENDVKSDTENHAENHTENNTGKRAPRAQSRARPTYGKTTPRAWHGPTRSAQAQRPLRVVRVVEPRACLATAGRMVISGRMEDVCAELDRLAALEAA